VNRRHAEQDDELAFYALLGVLQSGMWLQADIEHYLASFGLSHGRFSVMLSIMEGGRSSRIGREIADRLGVSRATVAKMVDRLIGDGHLACREVAADRRRRRYTLTQKGKRLLARVVPGYLARLRIMSAGVTPFEMQQLVGILSKINFLDPRKSILREHQRTITERSRDIRERCTRGSAADVDRVMSLLHEKADLPTTKIIDYCLGIVRTAEGTARIRHYLFHGTQMQRNYATLYFARRDEWPLVNQAYAMGLIDHVQAYSR